MRNLKIYSVYGLLLIALVLFVWGCSYDNTSDPVSQLLQKANIARDPDTRISYYSEAVATVYANIGTLHEKEGRFREAADMFYSAGQIYHGLEHLEIAMKLLKRAGWLYYKKLQDYTTAAKIFQAVLTVTPDDSEARGFLGGSFFYIGNSLLEDKKYFDAAAAYKYASELFTIQESQETAREKKNIALSQLNEQDKKRIENMKGERTAVEILGTEPILPDTIGATASQPETTTIMMGLIILAGLFFVVELILFLRNRKKFRHIKEGLGKLKRDLSEIQSLVSPGIDMMVTSRRSASRGQVEELNQYAGQEFDSMKHDIRLLQHQMTAYRQKVSNIEKILRNGKVEIIGGEIEYDADEHTGSQKPYRVSGKTPLAHMIGFDEDSKRILRADDQISISEFEKYEIYDKEYPEEHEQPVQQQVISVESEEEYPPLNEENLIEWWKQYGTYYDLQVCKRRLIERFGPLLDIIIVDPLNQNAEKWDILGVKKKTDKSFYVFPLRNGFFLDSMRKVFSCGTMSPSRSATIRSLQELARITKNGKTLRVEHKGKIELREK